MRGHQLAAAAAPSAASSALYVVMYDGYYYGTARWHKKEKKIEFLFSVMRSGASSTRVAKMLIT